MSKRPAYALIGLLVVSTHAAMAEEVDQAAKNGAPAYRICAGCHSLKPNVHLSGPSLAGLWGKKSASNQSYGRYTEELKKQDFVWDEDTLNAWLADPLAMVPGTTMTFRGIEDDRTRGDLIAFLRVAMAEGGTAKAVKEGLIPESLAEGQIPPDLSTVPANHKIKAIRHCRDAFHITLADGAAFPIWETNVRIKVDTSSRGPGEGEPVLLRSGMAGDRISVVFSSLTQLQQRLNEQC